VDERNEILPVQFFTAHEQWGKRGGSRHIISQGCTFAKGVSGQRVHITPSLQHKAGKIIGKSRSSVVTALHRLQDAGLVESVDRKWRLVEETAPKEPPPKWVSPVRGNDRAAHSHLT
jgi:hypothetical protein